LPNETGTCHTDAEVKGGLGMLRLKQMSQDSETAKCVMFKHTPIVDPGFLKVGMADLIE